MEVETQGTDPLTKVPTYVPLQKGKSKVPKDINERNSSQQTPILPDDIIFKGVHLGRVPVLKFEDCNLVDHKKFPHLETTQLMHQKKDAPTRITKFEPRKWLRGVEREGLLNLLWVPHYHHSPVTIFVIRQLLCLVHDGCLWLEKPIPIMDHLIYRITQLPCKGEDPANISKGKSDDLAIAEAMKKKFKLEKKKRGYAISNINNPVIKVTMQILVGKVIRKCYTDEVPTLVVALAVQCVKCVQFKWANYLCREFLENYREAQKQGNFFYYVWLLLSIVLMA